MTGQHFREIHHLVTDAAVVHDGTSHNENGIANIENDCVEVITFCKISQFYWLYQ